MPMKNPYSSFDDLRLSARGRKPYSTDERRVRSCSPVKTHRNVPGSLNDLKTFKLPAIDQDTISLSTSSSGSIQEQLKLLSHSPISKRLQISDSSKYTIPIPFTLQLPPRLSKSKEVGNQVSPPGSPPHKSNNSSPKTKRLFYTGSGYDIVDSDSDTEKKQEKKINKLPKRPTTNTTQSLKFKVLSEDDLSIIEEISNTSNSRKPSLISQNVTQCYPIQKADLLKRKIDKGSISYTSPFIGGSNSVYPTSSYLSYLDDHLGAESHFQSLKFDKETKLEEIKLEETKLEETKLEKTKLEKTKLEKTKLEKTKQDNNDLTENNTVNCASLKFKKSPKKVGLSFREKPLPQVQIIPSNKENSRNSENTYTVTNNSLVYPTEDISDSSTVSNFTVDSNSSLDSLQKSIDITNTDLSASNGGFISAHHLADSIVSEGMLSDILPAINIIQQSKENDKYNLESKETNADKEKHAINNNLYEEDEEDEEDEVTLPLNISRVTTVKTLDMNEREPTIDHNQESITKITDDYNIGTGKRFSFPNSSENITNSKEVKEKFRLSTLSNTRNPVQTSISELSRQIEIPDLSTLENSSINTHHKSKSMCSISGLTFDDLKSDTSYSSETTIDKSITNLEPIGVPSKEAQRVIKDQFKSMHQDSECGSGSDTETDINIGALSLYNHQRLSKSTSNVLDLVRSRSDVASGNSKEDECSSITRSFPIKHRRHKSMINIEFDVDKEIKPLNHKRDKSVDFKELKNRPLPSLPVISLEAEPKITVEEPPVPVTYPIDFKESNRQDINLLDNNSSRKSKNSKFINVRGLDGGMGWYNNSLRNRVDDFSSESSSSYQSSRSAKYTNSSISEISDADGVFIDLTKDNYDVCTILRKDSTTSYKSTTKKIENGKEYEIVIVDDVDTDELASIYSKYKQNWVTRKNSTTSNQSSTSSMSFGGSVSSVNQICLKGYDKLRDRNTVMSKNIMNRLQSQRSDISLTSSNASSLSRSYTSNRIKLPSSHQLKSREI